MAVCPDIEQIDAWLAQREATVPALRPHCAKHVRWASGQVQQTDIAVVYVHGFSATFQELHPLPQMVANGVGANLFNTRLTGHGQDIDAMGQASLEDWRTDIAEALAVASVLGRKVVAMGCSTGCTLLAEAMAQGAEAAALVFVSPNFGLAHPVAHHLLKLPLVRDWGHIRIGSDLVSAPRHPKHAEYWTPRYPAQAAYTMSDAVDRALAGDFGRCTMPLYVAYNPRDQVVSAERMRRALADWGGAVRYDRLSQTPQDDPLGHIMAGEVFSPQQTDPLAARILKWLRDEMRD